MSQIPEIVVNVCRQIGLDPQSAMWNCHGTWVMYHKALEQVAAQLSIKFDPPQIIEHDAKERICVMCVTGHWNERTEWTIGEAMPINLDRGSNKQQYPFAMAEKRAKDRVILKLIGLHGHVYSQDEFADPETDLNRNKASTPSQPPKPPSEPPKTPPIDLPAVDEPPFDEADYWKQWVTSEMKTFPHKDRKQLVGWYEGNKQYLSKIKQAGFIDLLNEIIKAWEQEYEERNKV